MTLSTPRYAALALAGLFAVASCAGIDDSDTTAASDTTTDSTSTDSTTSSSESRATNAAGSLDPAAFVDGALTADPVVEECTLADGSATDCYGLTIAGFPANRESIGPWCPATTSDGAAGIWFDGDDVYDIDGQFITDLADIYGDPTWKLYDENGNVLSTDTSEKFNDLVNGAPSDPDADPVNLCVYGEIEWAEGGGPIAATVEIPVNPVVADTPTDITGSVGVTLDGVLIEGSAPVDLILGNYTIGAFDPCGGHVNPQEGYHMHATTGCSDSTDEVGDGETALFGYALDGYAIHSPYDEDTAPDPLSERALDECNGHEIPELGYHYHANQVEENAVLSCFTGVTVQSEGGGRPAGGPPAGGAPGDGPPPADAPATAPEG